jgi:hypothetical protein
MYESPITEITNKLQDQLIMDYENGVMKAVYQVGFCVNKEELLKALKYDRGQYDKGYSDGYLDAIDEFAERCKGSVVCKLIGLRAIDIDFIAEEMKGEEHE